MSPHGITSWKKKYKDLPGRTVATDEKLLELYEAGASLGQIRTKHIIGLARLRKIVREYEATKEESS